MVLATQNPIEHHGTYPLPESQLDRFLMRIRMGYPARASEKEIMRNQSRPRRPVRSQIAPVMDAADVVAMQEAVSQVKVDESLLDYALEIVERTRQTEQLSLGVSPRGAVMLHRAAQARAFLEGRDYCLPDDFKRLIVPVFAHRVVVSSRYVSTQKKSEQAEAILREILDTDARSALAAMLRESRAAVADLTSSRTIRPASDMRRDENPLGSRAWWRGRDRPAGAISASPCWCFRPRCVLALFSAAVAQQGRILLAGITAAARAGPGRVGGGHDRPGAGAAHEPALARVPGRLPPHARRHHLSRRRLHPGSRRGQHRQQPAVS